MILLHYFSRPERSHSESEPATRCPKYVDDLSAPKGYASDERRNGAPGSIDLKRNKMGSKRTRGRTHPKKFAPHQRMFLNFFLWTRGARVGVPLEAQHLNERLTIWHGPLPLPSLALRQTPSCCSEISSTPDMILFLLFSLSP